MRALPIAYWNWKWKLFKCRRYLELAWRPHLKVCLWGQEYTEEQSFHLCWGIHSAKKKDKINWLVFATLMCKTETAAMPGKFNICLDFEFYKFWGWLCTFLKFTVSYNERLGRKLVSWHICPLSELIFTQAVWQAWFCLSDSVKGLLKGTE